LFTTRITRNLPYNPNNAGKCSHTTKGFFADGKLAHGSFCFIHNALLTGTGFFDKLAFFGTVSSFNLRQCLFFSNFGFSFSFL